MNKVFNIIENPEAVTVEIQGEIGGSWWSEGFTLDKLKTQLKGYEKGNKPVVVKIDSLGGDVDEALSIYECLVAMKERVTTECYGRCASAATIIAMAGDKRRMSRYALFLIHKCWSDVVGNENVLEEELEAQRAINSRLVAIYTDRTGHKQEEIEELMEHNNGDGSWLNTEQCLQYGFITEEITAEAGGEQDYLKQKIRAMFHLNSKEMKKSIVAFAALAALLAAQEVESNKEGKCLFDEEDLRKINDKLAQLESEKADLQSKLDAAETAKTEAEGKASTAEAAKATAENEKATLAAKVAELQAVVDQTPAQEPPAGGSDTRQQGSGTFADWYNQQGYVQEAKRELGLE